VSAAGPGRAFVVKGDFLVGVGVMWAWRGVVVVCPCRCVVHLSVGDHDRELADDVQPSGNVTREEMAAFLSRVIRALP
jgi:hypothetical protein